MKKNIILILISVCTGQAFSQLVNNNGAGIYIKQGGLVVVKTDSVNNMSGQIHNAGNFIIEGSFINNDTTTGAGVATGVYEVQGNWQNNAIFQADQSLVRLTGAAPQLITGSQVTTFHNLSLENATTKTQRLDAITANNLDLNDCELATDIHRMTVTNPSPAAIQRTTGFVSSLANGQLARHTNQNVYYLFPLGSSVGTTRYRPAYFRPLNTNPNEYGGRLANTDATIEGWDRNIKEADICTINPLFYHRLYQNSGNANADIRIQYDAVADGSWETATQWRNLPEWEKITGVTMSGAAGTNIATWQNWGNFNAPHFALANLSPVIDTSNLEIVAEYCGPHGQISGIHIDNLMLGTSYTWLPAGQTGLVPSNGNVPVFGDLLTGNYTLQINKPNGCNAQMNFNVGFTPTYTTNITVTNVDCYGASTGAADLTTNGGFSPFTYLWKPGSAVTQDLNNVKAGTYIVTIKDSKNCIQSDTITITQPPRLLATTDFENEYCERSNGVGLVEASGGTPGYTYTWNTSPEQYGTNIQNLPAGSYTVTVEDANGCTLDRTIVIDNIESPIASFVTDMPTDSGIIISNATVAFDNTSQYATSYSWNFGDELTSLATNPFHSYQEAGQYTVSLTAYNAAGCSSLYILGVFNIIPDGAIYIPNAFTPNDDGNNDDFKAVGLGVSEFRMTIFDRWGKEIKTMNALAETWDGTSKGQDAPEGTYTYLVYYRLNSGAEKKMAGTIILVR